MLKHSLRKLSRNTRARLSHLADNPKAKPEPGELDAIADELIFGSGRQPRTQPHCNRFLLTPRRADIIAATEQGYDDLNDLAQEIPGLERDEGRLIR